MHAISRQDCEPLLSHAMGNEVRSSYSALLSFINTFNSWFESFGDCEATKDQFEDRYQIDTKPITPVMGIDIVKTNTYHIEQSCQQNSTNLATEKQSSKTNTLESRKGGTTATTLRRTIISTDG